MKDFLFSLSLARRFSTSRDDVLRLEEEKRISLTGSWTQRCSFFYGPSSSDTVREGEVGGTCQIIRRGGTPKMKLNAAEIVKESFVQCSDL